MYYTKLTKGRFIVPVTLRSDLYVSRVDLKLDTGAEYTAVSAATSALLKSMFKSSDNTKTLHSAIASSALFKEVDIPRLQIGDICLFDQKVYITDDKNVKDNLLGMDILSQIEWRYRSIEQTLYLKEPSIDRVTNANIKQAVYRLLSEKHAYTPSRAEQLISLLPKHIDLSYTDLVGLLKI